MPGVNDLATTHPDLAHQAADWDPTTVTAKRHKKARWRCPLGHEWETVIYDRVKLNSQCHVCSNLSVLAGFNDLATTHPDLAAEADGWDPSTVHKGMSKKVAWRCHRAQVWVSNTKDRVRGSGCPYCAGKRAIPGETDLATTHPDLAAEGLFDPTTVSAGSGKKMPWRCLKGHEWAAAVASRTAGRGCPVCSNRLIVPGFNDLATLRPDLAAEADGWDPATAGAGTNKKMPWRCLKGHEWKAVVGSRTGGRGCPVCSGNAVLAGFNDLASVAPSIAAEADGWDPRTVTAGSRQKLPWKCAYGHCWTTSADKRTSGQGCPYCGNKSVMPGFNDLATTHPALAAEAVDWDPSTLTAGSDKKVAWRCLKGHEWKAVVYSRAIGRGCPICAGRQVLVGFNDLRTIHPDIAAEATGWDPATVTAVSGEIRLWRCGEGHEWKARVANRRNGSGCPVCAITGFNPGADGWLYLMRHDDWQMLQVGITNHPRDRFALHAGHGWEPLEIRGPMDGVLTQEWESSILKYLQLKGVSLVSSTTRAMPERTAKLRGWGEAWWKSDFDISSITRLMALIHDSEETDEPTYGL